MKRRLSLPIALSIGAGVLLGAPREAAAFCGFYVAPDDKPLYNDATQVALMREGNRTAISMANNYKGPAADFAMVVPVPVVLQKDDVKTLPRDVFDRLDKLTAPRLVEYWELDPCPGPTPPMKMAPTTVSRSTVTASPKAAERSKDYGVTIEAKFSVGEYDILVLSAKQSDGLERWLIDNKYNIPKGASAALAPYIKEQQKFFVAKINIKKVELDGNGVASLSPLRFHYETSEFRLPVRLGLLNAKGKQDLIVWTLSQSTRYEAANYSNIFVPTNLEVQDSTRKAFAPFYAALFDAAIDKAANRAVVTEYSWAAGSCDPCPVPPLTGADLATLGGDVLLGMAPTLGGTPKPSAKVPPGPSPGGPPSPMPRPMPFRGYYGNIVLTRLHTRYDSAALTEDLVFRSASPIVGGRETMYGPGSVNEQGASPSSVNNFQARYIIRHAWTGPIACKDPQRGRWGGPPAGTSYQPRPATGLAAAPRGSVSLVGYLKAGMPAFDVRTPAGVPLLAVPSASAMPESDAGAMDAEPDADDAGAGDATLGGAVPPVETGPKRGCGCEVPGGSVGSAIGLGAMAIALFVGGLRRRARE